jgi:GTPase
MAKQIHRRDKLEESAISRIVAENDEGNKEYKLKLFDSGIENINHIVTQMRYRLDEGCGEAIYTVGVTDAGGVIGLTEEEFTKTKEILDVVVSKCGAVMTLLSEQKVVDSTTQEERKLYEFLIREHNHSRYVDVRVACAGNVDAGKCECKNTKIRLYSGQIKNIQDITTKDVLIGDDGTKRKILETTKGFGQMYKITPTNGEPFTVNKNHILCFKASNYNYVYYDKQRERYGVRCFIWENYLPKVTTVFFPLQRESRKFHRVGMKFYETPEEAEECANTYLANFLTNLKCIKYQDVVELSLEQYVNLNKFTQSALKLYRVGVNYPEKDVPFDAYMFGYWLGDGTKGIPEITTADADIVEHFQNTLPIYGLCLRKPPSAKYRYSICSAEGNEHGCNHFRNFIKEFSLTEKYIPNVFKHNSRQVRLDILAGLVDSDGYLEKCKSGYTFTMTKKNERLVDDIIEVSRSLGFASYKKYCIKTCTNGKDGPVKCECISFSIYGKGIEELQPVLTRKSAKPRDTNKDVLLTSIKNITIEPDQEYYGFELGGNGRYIHDDFTVTHNSSLLGVLLTGKNDNGRGTARLNVFNFQHEVKTGRTSSVAQHILGFDENGLPVTIDDDSGHKKTWMEIVQSSSKVVTFFDLCGHEKYLKTTIMGLTSNSPDLVMILVGGNMGMQRMTKEHIFLCLSLHIPFIIIITKLDLCKDRQQVLEETINEIKSVLKAPGIRRIPYDIRCKEDVLLCSKNIHSLTTVPLFYISNVTGEGVDYVRQFLNLHNKKPKKDQSENKVEYYVDQTFQVVGVGTVLGGQLVKGKIKIGDKLLVGPINDEYTTIQVRSIHCKRMNMTEVDEGCYVCLGIKKPDELTIRRGNAVISPIDKPIQCKEFEAEIVVLKTHSTTIKPGYEPVVHTCSIRQTARIMAINGKMCSRGQTGDDGVLRTGDKATIKFQFCYKPEYIRKGFRILLAEGRVKIIGKVSNVTEEIVKVV